jgi:hypothetical protein
MRGLGFDAKSAVPLNLMISLVTLTFAMISRSGSVSLAAIIPHFPEVIGLAVGGMGSAIYGVRLVRRLSGERLVQLIAFLLIGIGGLLLWEAAFPFQYAPLLPASAPVHLLVRPARPPIGTHQPNALRKNGHASVRCIYLPRSRNRRECESPSHIGSMNLQLSDDQAAALISELDRIIDDDRYPLSPRIKMLKAIRAKLKPEPVRQPLPPE